MQGGRDRYADEMNAHNKRPRSSGGSGGGGMGGMGMGGMGMPGDLWNAHAALALSGMGMAGMGGMGPPMGLPFAPYGERPFPVVRLRGLPFTASDHEIVDFFSGIEVLDVVFVSRMGRPTGEAVVLLPSPMFVEFALQRNRNSIGRRYIEVFRAGRGDYYRAVAEAVWDGGHDGGGRDHGGGGGGGDRDRDRDRDDRGDIHRMTGGGGQRSGGGDGGRGGGGGSARDREAAAAAHTSVIKLRGLPFSCTTEDIAAFFDPAMTGLAPVAMDAIHIAVDASGKATGIAFVEFASAEDAKKAAISRDRAVLKTRYIEIFPSSREEATRSGVVAGSQTMRQT